MTTPKPSTCGLYLAVDQTKVNRYLNCVHHLQAPPASDVTLHIRERNLPPPAIMRFLGLLRLEKCFQKFRLTEISSSYDGSTMRSLPFCTRLRCEICTQIPQRTFAPRRASASPQLQTHQRHNRQRDGDQIEPPHHLRFFPTGLLEVVVCGRT